ncbi:hypothetical protein ACFL2V_09320 [Pseudomonadota bacterium]
MSKSLESLSHTEGVEETPEGSVERPIPGQFPTKDEAKTSNLEDETLALSKGALWYMCILVYREPELLPHQFTKFMRAYWPDISEDQIDELCRRASTWMLEACYSPTHPK